MYRMSFITISVLIAVLSSAAMGQHSGPKETEVKGHTMYTLLNPGDIPAIFNPEFLPVGNAADQYWPEEPIIVVAGDEEARAYSTWHLDHHEVVNDRMDGSAIAVTW